MGHDLTIVTLTRNPDYFKRLLSSLGTQTGDIPSYLGVVVMNDYNQLGIITEAQDRGWATLDPRHNASFSAGNNMGVRVAPSTDWILLLNDDVIPEPEFLSKLWSHRDKADVVGALLINNDGSVNHAGTLVESTCRSDHIGRGVPRDRYIGCRFVYTPSVTFAVALIRREMFDKVGGLDERYFYGFEDLDFCMKVLDEGGSVGCARDAVATHNEHGTRPRDGVLAQQNAKQFMDIWATRVPTILQDYKSRMRGTTIEGV